jgi:hypothetical protein
MSLVLNGTTGITNPGAYTGDGVSFADGTPSNTLVTTTGGNVGIGTSSPGYKLQVNGGASNNNNDANTIVATGTNHVRLKVHTPTTGGFRASLVLSSDEAVTSAGNEVSISTTGSDEMQFATANAERMRIDSAGNVGIGTSSPSVPLSVVSSGQVVGNFAHSSTSTDANNGGAIIRVQNTSSTNNNMESLIFANASGTGTSAIFGYNANQSTNEGFMTFGTRNSSGTFAERARIDSSGNLLVGTTATVNSGKAIIDYQGGGRGLGIVAPSNANGAQSVHFYAGGTQVGNISVTTSATAYSTSSDYRLKHDIQPMQNALATVAQLKPVTYKWNADDSQSQGFIAHELQEVVPECVTGEKDAVDAEGKPVYQGIDTSFLAATMVAAMQEQQAIIEQLKADVAALKGAQG